METRPAVSRAACKSSSRKGLKTPPVTVVESFTVWNNNNSTIMLEDAQESKHPHLSLPELITSTNLGMGSPNTRWKRTHSRLNTELPECKWTTLAFRQTQRSRGARWSLESAGLMSAGLEARIVEFFMNSKCFKQIKLIFAEVICANPSNPVNLVVKDKDKSTLFVPCTCQVVKSVLYPLWPILFQGAVGSHCEAPGYQILGFIRILCVDTDWKLTMHTWWRGKQSTWRKPHRHRESRQTPLKTGHWTLVSCWDGAASLHRCSTRSVHSCV